MPLVDQKAILRIVLLYALFSGTWILLSDYLLAALVSDALVLTWLQTYKGWLYTIIASIFLYWLLRRQMKILENIRSQHVRELEQTTAALRKSEERFQIALKNSPTVVFAQDRHLRYTWIENPRWALPSGYFLGKTDLDIFEPLTASRLWALKTEVLKTGVGVQTELWMVSGEISGYFDLTIEPTFDSHGEVNGLICSAADLTEIKLANERAEQQVKRLAALRKIDQAITSTLDLRVTLDVLLDQVSTLLDVDAASVLLLNPELQQLEFAAGVGFRTARFREMVLAMGQGLAGLAAIQRRGSGVVDLKKSTDFIPRDALIGDEFVQYINLPLIAKGEVEGVLEVFNRTYVDWDPEWLQFFEALAGQAAIAIDNMMLYEQLKRKNTDLMVAYDATLEGWSRALELRDQETDGHSRRVTDLAVRLAHRLGLSDGDLVDFRRGTLLHDIGKMGVPDSILLKPGPLNSDEWAIMRNHPKYAYQMLAPIPYLRRALDIPYCHHEHWDGSGYPRGLRGEEIPLGARIFAVVDVWDALRSDRPYRPAWPPDKALQYIKDRSGRQFDPQVVQAFVEIVEKAR